MPDASIDVAGLTNAGGAVANNQPGSDALYGRPSAGALGFGGATDPGRQFGADQFGASGQPGTPFGGALNTGAGVYGGAGVYSGAGGAPNVAATIPPVRFDGRGNFVPNPPQDFQRPLINVPGLTTAAGNSLGPPGGFPPTNGDGLGLRTSAFQAMLMNSGNEEAAAAIANDPRFVNIAAQSERLQSEMQTAQATGAAPPNLLARTALLAADMVEYVASVDGIKADIALWGIDIATGGIFKPLIREVGLRIVDEFAGDHIDGVIDALSANFALRAFGVTADQAHTIDPALLMRVEMGIGGVLYAGLLGAKRAKPGFRRLIDKVKQNGPKIATTVGGAAVGGVGGVIATQQIGHVPLFTLHTPEPIIETVPIHESEPIIETFPIDDSKPEPLITPIHEQDVEVESYPIHEGGELNIIWTPIPEWSPMDWVSMQEGDPLLEKEAKQWFKAHPEYLYVLPGGSLKGSNPSVTEVVKVFRGIGNANQDFSEGKANVDANIVIHAVRRGNADKVDELLDGRNPVVSPGAVRELLDSREQRPVESERLRRFMEARGGSIGKAPTAEQLRLFEDFTKRFGRQPSEGDRAVMVSALNENTILLTTDGNVFMTFKEMGLPVALLKI
jgi:hypothetical protein